MAEGAGNAVTLPELLGRGVSGRAVRLFLIATHYRQPLHFSQVTLEAARASLERLDALCRNLRSCAAPGRTHEIDPLIEELGACFREAILDDMNVSAALAALFRFLRRANALLGSGRMGQEDAAEALAALARCDVALGILCPAAEAAPLPEEVERLVAERDAARREKRFADADALRERLAGLGYVVEDTAAGTRTRRK